MSGYLVIWSLHRYRVIRMWEQDPAPLLANPGLLPLATLARSESPDALLEQVAARVATIEETEQRRNILASAEILAGLRFEKELISQLFREEIMEESVIYQDIIQKGEQRGAQRGRKEGELSLILRLLARRFDAVDRSFAERLEQLSIPQLEEFGEMLLDFSTVSQAIAWLDDRGL